MLANAKDDDLVFGNSVESLFQNALGHRLTPRCLERAREAGIDLARKPEAFYPRAVFYACVRAVAEELFPDRDLDGRMYEMGKAFMQGFERTSMGRATLEAMRAGGPRRALEKLALSFRAANNYMKVDFVEHGPKDVEVSLSQTSGAPGFFEAVLAEVLAITGGKNGEIHRKVDDGALCVFTVRWM